MDVQDQTKTTIPLGHESGEVLICHRCGWPFPHLHPSSKHRRAHKRVCGTIEGYPKLIHSDDDDDDNTPNAAKLLDNPTEVKKPHDNLKTQDTDTKENSVITQVMLPDSVTKTSGSLGDETDGTHKDNFIETFEVSDNEDQGEEVYVLSVPSDIPLVEHAHTLLDDFKDHTTVYSRVPRDDKDAENRSIVDNFEVKTAEENIEENSKSAFVPTVFAQVVKTQPLEMSETVPESTDNLSEPEASSDKLLIVTLGEKIETEGDGEEITREKFESHQEHAQQVTKTGEINLSVPVLTEAYTWETGIEDTQKIMETVAADSKHSGNVAISERVEHSHDPSGVISERIVDESVDSSSRNSVEGNWGSVSVLSTASVDADNSHSIGKSDISMDKSRLGKSYAFEDPALVESKQKTNAVTVQISQPPKAEANVSNETEGRKRNEEAIAKVTNWSTGEHPAAPLKNLVSETKSSNPKQLPTMIQNDEAVEKISDPEKSNLTSGTPQVNQDPSSPNYIGEGKKVGKKTKGRASWVPFVCCSSVNVN